MNNVQFYWLTVTVEFDSEDSEVHDLRDSRTVPYNSRPFKSKCLHGAVQTIELKVYKI